MDGLEADVAPEVSDQAVDAEVTPEAVEDRFTDLDPAEAPDGEITSEWLQERYKQMQGDYTRKTQAAAEAAKQRDEESNFLEALRSDPDTQRAVLEHLSELLSGEPDEDVIDDSEAVDPIEERLQQLESERANEKATALAREITQHIDQLANDAGFELDDADRRFLFERATAGEKITPEGTQKAFQDFHAREQAKQDKWQKSYLASKTASQQVPAGATATDAPANTHENRVKQMAARMMAGD